MCIYCRPCTAKEPCDLDKDWSEEQWEEVEERRKEKAAKKVPDMAMVLQSINMTQWRRWKPDSLPDWRP